MRTALSGLTTRGRSFLAAGVAAMACALVLQQRDLLRVGLFLVALPLVAAAVVTSTRYRLSCDRRLEPRRVQSGEVAEAVLQLHNVSRLPTGVLLMEDTLPYLLGGRPRFVLDRVPPGARREVRYPISSDVRGRFSIGPLSVRLTDPFGLCELTRSFTTVDDLVVTPVVSALPAVRLGGDWAGGGDSSARSVAAAGDDDAATREYRHGDDLRKVHWRSTAHAGELMVRREEQPWQSRATVLLDTRARAHRGEGPGSSLEWAVSAAASIGVHLLGSGLSLRLVDDTGLDPVVGGGLDEGLLLDRLAEITASPNATVLNALSALRRGEGGVVVAVLGAMAAEEAEQVARLRTGSTSCVAVLIDTASWAGGSPRGRAAAQADYDSSAALLVAYGWRVLRVAHGTTLAAVWPEASIRPGTLAGAAR